MGGETTYDHHGLTWIASVGRTGDDLEILASLEPHDNRLEQPIRRLFHPSTVGHFIRHGRFEGERADLPELIANHQVEILSGVLVGPANRLGTVTEDGFRFVNQSDGVEKWERLLEGDRLDGEAGKGDLDIVDAIVAEGWPNGVGVADFVEVDVPFEIFGASGEFLERVAEDSVQGILGGVASGTQADVPAEQLA